MPQLRLERGVVGEAGKLKPGPGRSAQEVASHQLGRIHAAMIDLVAEQGYDAVTVRGLTRHAGISSRSFYKHYAGKEECLLAVHRLLALKTLRKLSEAQAEASNPRDAIRLAVTRVVSDWGSAPNDANLLLLAPYRAGRPAMDQLRQAEAIFRVRLERSITDVGGEGATAAFVARAIVDGLVAVGCSQLSSDDGSRLASQADQLAGWACNIVDPAMGKLEELDEDRHGGMHRSQAVPQGNLVEARDPADSNSDRILLLAAVTKLVTRDRGSVPTPDEIVAVAGLSRRTFHANFPDVESCVAAALDSKLEGVLQSAQRTAREGEGPAECVFRAVDFLAQLATDPALSSFCCADTVSTMILARVRLQGHIAARINHSILEAGLGANASELHAAASAGAFWGALRHYLAGHSAEEAQELTAHLTYLILAPAIGGHDAIGAIEQEQTFSVA